MLGTVTGMSTNRSVLRCFAYSEAAFWRTLARQAWYDGKRVNPAPISIEEEAFYDRASVLVDKFSDVAHYSDGHGLGPKILDLDAFSAALKATCDMLHDRAAKKQWLGPLPMSIFPATTTDKVDVTEEEKDTEEQNV